jgi:nucleotide-binding universal stress UspA family protein
MMRRILVPLDGSPFAELIIRDARRLAGADGTLVLVRDASRPSYDLHLGVAAGPLTVSECESYLETMARQLREQGVLVEIHTTFLNDISVAINAAAELFDVDMIACSTHGRTVMGRLVRGGAAWRALAGSNVPVLLRHEGEQSTTGGDAPEQRQIMVPLDGSVCAEKALPLAQELALEWNARLVLVRVVTISGSLGAPYGLIDTYAVQYESEIASARGYLNGVASTLKGDVQTKTCAGVVVDRLEDVVEAMQITDVVMASHGRTGLSRVILGSVADSFIHRVHLPIVVVPALVTTAREAQIQRKDTRPIPAHA